MRFLSTFLLSLCCLAAALQSNATNDIPVRSAKASNEYRAIEQALPNDALNDYHQPGIARNTVINTSFPKESPSYCNGNSESIGTYILNDSFQSFRLVFTGNHAKAFRKKLIFPQHYYW